MDYPEGSWIDSPHGARARAAIEEADARADLLRLAAECLVSVPEGQTADLPVAAAKTSLPDDQ